MSLQVFTARLSPSLRDPDMLDVTRQTAARERKQGRVSLGEPFAPSWAILKPAIEARHQAAAFQQAVKEAAEAALWATHAPAYRAEMRQSYRQHRKAWDELLARSRVVLACMCALRPGEDHCHRRLLAGYLAALGAEDKGEIA